MGWFEEVGDVAPYHRQCLEGFSTDFQIHYHKGGRKMRMRRKMKRRKWLKKKRTMM